MVKGALKKGASMSIIGEFNTEKKALTEELRMRPSEMIGWNLTKGGGKPPVFNPTPENRARVSAQFKGTTQSPEHIRKRADARRGSRNTPESIEKMREAAKSRGVARVTCLKCDKEMDIMNYHRSHGDKCGIRQGDAWNTGIKMTERTCPHCKKTGRGGNMTRYHFENCKLKTLTN
jgi:peroxiredoxin family protein